MFRMLGSLVDMGYMGMGVVGGERSKFCCGREWSLSATSRLCSK